MTEPQASPSQHTRTQPPEHERDSALARIRDAIFGLVALVVLVGAGWYVYRELDGPGVGADASRGGSAVLAANGGLQGEFDLSNLQVPRNRILSGGPRKDGIPSLTTAAARQDERSYPHRPPNIVPASEGNLQPNARVVGVELNGEARAYPIPILNYHEVVNDLLGGVPIAVVYCPLCDSVSVVDRRIDGKTLEFGISGRLMNSNVLMYDRTNQALWSQAKLEAISGPHAGKSLSHLDQWSLTTWKAWREAHPDGSLLTTPTGHSRRYADNPYRSYFGSERLMFPVEPRDDRLPAKTRVIGVRLGDTAVAYPLEAIREAADQTLTTQINGKTLTLQAVDNGIEVVQTPDEAEVLHTFWFAWAAFHPETQIARRNTDR